MTKLVYISSTGGHREDYYLLFSHFFTLDYIKPVHIFNPPVFVKVIFAKYVLFGTLDDHKLLFILISLLRALLFRNTNGIFLNPASVQIGFKHSFFSFLKYFRSISTYGILPPDIDNVYPSRICTSWIYDPNLWDLPYLSDSQSLDISFSYDTTKKFKLVKYNLYFMGRISLLKGFQLLVDLVNSCPDLLNYFNIRAFGVVDDDCKSLLTSAEMLDIPLFNNFLSGSDFMRTFSESDLMWSCYTPEYDQSSGIFGRAYQMNKPVIVRENSKLHRLADRLQFPVLVLNPDDLYNSARLVIEFFESRAVNSSSYQSKVSPLQLEYHSISNLRNSSPFPIHFN